MSIYIDADALCEEFKKFVRKANNHDFEPTPNWNDAISIFHSMPTVDAVEVVRCKDCENWDAPYCSVLDDAFDEEFFCALGERRKNEV